VNAIEIVYDNKKVEDLFSDFSRMQKKCGADLTKQIKKRFGQIKAAQCFFDYLSLGLGSPHSLEGEFAGCYGISVTGNIRIILKPICDDLTPESLKACDEAILKGVADYHGQKVEWIIP
jgi:proteic killer suppression protein/toxin YoeB